jgi:glycosyltransferase involved in cell wall biosynthesis
LKSIFSPIRKGVLILNNSNFESGAELSLYEFFAFSTNKYRYYLTKTKKSKNNFLSSLSYKTYTLPYLWICKTYNPFRIIQYIFSIIISSIKIIWIVNKNDIQIIYANTIKAALYGVLAKRFTNIKLVCHIRDNIEPGLAEKFLIKKDVAFISNSKHVCEQFTLEFKNIHLIYSGVDIEKWKIKENEMFDSMDKEKLGLYYSVTSTSIVVACIGQLTRWKKQTDFIHAAKIILARYENVLFLVVGDDLSGREKKYKNELLKLAESLNLTHKVYFVGHKENIVEVMNSIDILVHPAINEPFGRVLIEAMALEKPIVAYNCGGPSEIIIDGETGFLVEPHNFEQLAEKTMKLINDKEICIRMGKAGRQRVVEKFNIERYVREMEEVFDNVMEHG